MRGGGQGVLRPAEVAEMCPLWMPSPQWGGEVQRQSEASQGRTATPRCQGGAQGLQA